MDERGDDAEADHRNGTQQTQQRGAQPRIGTDLLQQRTHGTDGRAKIGRHHQHSGDEQQPREPRSSFSHEDQFYQVSGAAQLSRRMNGTRARGAAEI